MTPTSLGDPFLWVLVRMSCTVSFVCTDRFDVLWLALLMIAQTVEHVVL